MDSSGDVTLVVEGLHLKCSKMRLAKHSNYFKTMFEGCFMERDMKVVTMHGVDVQSLKTCLLMLRNRKLVPKDEEDLALVLQTACMLQFEEISGFIGNKLLADLDVTNCFRVWFLTEPLNLVTVSLKAKKMALVEFNTIKDLNDLLKLTKEQLHLYLANVHLVCNELDVFSAFMNWYSKNGGNVMDVLACLDFHRLSNEDIENMMSNIHASKSLALVNVLKCVLAVKKGEYVKNLHLSLNLAHKVLNCNRRGSWMKPRFFEGVESEVEGIEDKVSENDVQSFWKTLNLRLKEEIFNKYFEHRIIRKEKKIFLLRKQYIGDIWDSIPWLYYSLQHRWQIKRFYDTHPIIRDSWLDANKIEKSVKAYSKVARHGDLLPNESENCKSCDYKDTIIVFYNRIKCGYIYKYRYRNFFHLRIEDTKNFPNINDNFSVYCVKDRIFVKDVAQLVELRIGRVLSEDILYVVKVSALLPDNSNAISDKSVLCHNVQYIISKNKNALKLESVCRDHCDFRFGTITYGYDTSCEMMWPDDSNLVGKDKYVNTIENLFGKVRTVVNYSFK